MDKLILTVALLAIAMCTQAQQKYIEGNIEGIDPSAKLAKPIPLVQANVYWAETTTGTVSNENGHFKLSLPDKKNLKLVVSYIGYKNDTIAIEKDQENLEIILEPSKEIDEVTVYERQKGSYISKIEAIQTETVTSAGLLKLPCCNLAESFENTATVDVGYADAVSGAKQIQMLGLAGKYSQIIIEKKPAVRGLASNFGLSYIPGTWMESIQVSKGTASVIDGYESISGQINVEFKKPESSDPLHVNIYGNHLGRMEANVTSAQKINEHWSTMLLLSGGNNQVKHDLNKDNFIDLPLSTQVHVMNRWKYETHKNYTGQFGFTFLNEDRNGGQMLFNEDEPQNNAGLYGIGINTRRYDLYGKNGFRLRNPNQSIGMIASASQHEVSSYYGNRNYTGEQTSLYTNFIFRTILVNTNHSLSTGISFLYDDYNEHFEGVNYLREEIVPGIFTEYNYTLHEKLNFIAGARYDHNNLYGNFFTPRVHVKYNIGERSIIRGSVGKGYKVANVFSENPGIFASSRNIVLEEELEAEEAWNMGMNFTHDFNYGEKEATVSLDFYRTQFINQVVVDMDRDLHNVYFYNLDGESFSNSFQAEIRTEPMERFEITTAVRYNNVKLTIDNELKSKPFVNKFKALLGMSYATNYNKWMFDVNLQYNGKGRLPEVLDQVASLEYTDYSPGFFMLQAQVTKQFRYFSVYAGGENLTGFVQDNPIIGAHNPFGPDFDASMVWGPIIGRRFFVGLRYTLER